MVRGLPGRTRVVAGVCLALLACLVAATFLVHLLPTRFAEVTWSDDGRRLGLPRVALYLTLAGLAVAPAVILAGASRSIPLLFIGAGLVQLYAVLFTAFVGGKAYWLAALTWLLPVLAATSPASTWGRRGRLVATTALCALAAWHTYRVTPWSAGGRPPAWSWLAILFLVAAVALPRLPRRLGVGGAVLLAAGVNGAVLALGLRAGEEAMARGLVLPMSFLVGLFSVYWFVLGGGLMEGAVGTAHVAIRVAAAAVGRSWLLPVLAVLWVAELAAAPWLLDRLPLADAFALSLHRVVAGALLLGAALLAVRRAWTPGWARGLLGVWVFSFAALRAYFSNLTDLAAFADPQDLEVMGVSLFALGIAMQVVKLLTRPPDGRDGWLPPEAALLVSLGALTFLATGTHFGFAVRSGEVMRDAAAYQWSGATALFLPALLALALREQRWVRAPAPGLLLRAFVVGFAAAVAVQLLRVASHGPGGWSLAGHLGAVALGDAVKLAVIVGLVTLGRAAGRVDAQAAAVACALGFGAGYAQNLGLLLIDSAVKILLPLTVSIPALNRASSDLVYAHLAVGGAVPAAEHYHLSVAALLPAAVMGWAVGRSVRERRVGPGLAGGAGGAALSLLLAAALHLHPLYMRHGREPVAFYEVAWDPGALALLLAPTALLGLWLYLTVWRPERAAGDEGAAPAAPRRRRATAPALAATVLALLLGGAGVAVALRAPAPMLAYRDPQGRFAIEHPRAWRAEALATGETRFRGDAGEHGPLLLVHPGIPLPGGVTAPQLVQFIERQIRSVHKDFQMSVTARAPRVEGGRSLQALELRGTWSVKDHGRFRARTRLMLIAEGEAARFAYVTYQVPEGAPAWLESLLSRALASYRQPA